MDHRTGEALALGGATGLLVALLARVVVVPEALAGVAVPLVVAGGVPAGFVAGMAVSPVDACPGRVGAVAGGVGGLALAGSLWLGMATVLTLPHATPVWWLAYLFAVFGPVTATSSALAGEFWPVAFALCVLSVHAIGGAVGARLAALYAQRRGRSVQ